MARIDIRPGPDPSSNHAYVVNDTNTSATVTVGVNESCPTGSRQLLDQVHNLAPGEARFCGGTVSGVCNYHYFVK